MPAPMFADARVPIGPDETSDEIERDSPQLGARAARSTSSTTGAGRAVETPQDDVAGDASAARSPRPRARSTGPRRPVDPQPGPRPATLAARLHATSPATRLVLLETRGRCRRIDTTGSTPTQMDAGPGRSSRGGRRAASWPRGDGSRSRSRAPARRAPDDDGPRVSGRAQLGPQAAPASSRMIAPARRRPFHTLLAVATGRADLPPPSRARRATDGRARSRPRGRDRHRHAALAGSLDHLVEHFAATAVAHARSRSARHPAASASSSCSTSIACRPPRSSTMPWSSRGRRGKRSAAGFVNARPPRASRAAARACRCRAPADRAIAQASLAYLASRCRIPTGWSRAGWRGTASTPRAWVRFNNDARAADAAREHAAIDARRARASARRGRRGDRADALRAATA